jgi:RimJ/RimL family protein N-acetyltransferase
VILSKFGFEQEEADMIFGLVGDHNPRSIGAFKKAGYQVEAQLREPPGGKSKFSYDLVLRREQWGEF